MHREAGAKTGSSGTAGEQATATISLNVHNKGKRPPVQIAKYCTDDDSLRKGTVPREAREEHWPGESLYARQTYPNRMPGHIGFPSLLTQLLLRHGPIMYPSTCAKQRTIPCP